MQISYKTDYSLKIILYLSRLYPESHAPIKEIAQSQDIPKKFLEQVLLLLKKGGFLLSKKGPKGGYFLAKEPKDIRLGDVVRFVEGPIHPISCIAPGLENSCNFASTCIFRDIWQDVESSIAGVIDNIDFQELLQREDKKRALGVMDYQI